MSSKEAKAERRRRRILAGSENRLKFITQETESLTEPSTHVPSLPTHSPPLPPSPTASQVSASDSEEEGNTTTATNSTMQPTTATMKPTTSSSAPIPASSHGASESNRDVPIITPEALQTVVPAASRSRGPLLACFLLLSLGIALWGFDVWWSQGEHEAVAFPAGTVLWLSSVLLRNIAGHGVSQSFQLSIGNIIRCVKWGFSHFMFIVFSYSMCNAIAMHGTKKDRVETSPS